MWVFFYFIKTQSPGTVIVPGLCKYKGSRLYTYPILNIMLCVFY